LHDEPIFGKERVVIDFNLLDQKYGKNWAYFMPPNARPFRLFANSEALNPATIPLEASPLEIRTNAVKTTQREVAVIQCYACVANEAIPNPYWLGRLPTPLPEFAFQGRIQWTVMQDTRRQNDAVVLGGVTYQNDPAAAAVTPNSRMGIPLLKEFCVGNGAQPIIVPAGATAYVGLYAMPDLWGADPPPNDSPPIVFTTTLLGYYLDYGEMPQSQTTQGRHSDAIDYPMRGGLVS